MPIKKKRKKPKPTPFPFDGKCIGSGTITDEDTGEVKHFITFQVRVKNPRPHFVLSTR